MIRKNNNKLIYIKKLLSCLCLLYIVIMLCTGCTNNPSNNIENPLITAAVSPKPADDSIIYSDIISAAPIPAGTGKNIAITIDEAKILILNNIDITRYILEVLNESLIINDEEYYAFIVKEDNIVHAPVLVVRKDIPEVLCYEEDGTLNPFSNFPYYVPDNDIFFEWNGTYIHYNASGNPIVDIEISSADSYSFIFKLRSNNGSDDDNEITGSAVISGNTAVYSIENVPILLFVVSESALSVTYTPIQEDADTSSAYTAVFYMDAPSIS